MSFTFKIEKLDKMDRIFLIGNLNEDAEVILSDLKTDLDRDIIFNFHEVTMINSCGVRAWINFFREVTENKEVVFEHCTPVVVGQINMIPNFLGHGKITSVYADFACDSCGATELRLYEKGKNLPDNPEEVVTENIACKACGGELEMEELEEEFFAFLEAS